LFSIVRRESPELDATGVIPIDAVFAIAAQYARIPGYRIQRLRRVNPS
jgi:hypothetical protein